jgi:hypothetical protein
MVTNTIVEASSICMWHKLTDRSSKIRLPCCGYPVKHYYYSNKFELAWLRIRVNVFIHNFSHVANITFSARKLKLVLIFRLVDVNYIRELVCEIYVFINILKMY